MERKNQRGFTLIEVMITIAILGILVAIAIPLFNTHRLKSKTAEAKINLEAIMVSQVSYMAEFNTFQICSANPSAGVPGVNKAAWDTGTAFENIGFSPKDAKVHYQYEVSAGAKGITGSFIGSATGNLDGDVNNAVYQATENSSVAQTFATIGYY